MTEPMSPEQAGAGRPRFDPARSAAIRSLLIETVEAEGRGAAAAAAPSPHRRRRTAVIVALAVLAGGIASGTAAIALTGGSLFGPPEPAVTTVAPTPTPTPTRTPTPTPTPTPTTPPNPPAPVVRVPATCDQLLPQSTAEQMVGTALQPSAGGHPAFPVAYSNLRVGSLACGWSVGPAPENSPSGPFVDLLIVPSTDAEDLLNEANREGIYIDSPQVDIGDDVYSYCPTPGNWCSYIGQVGGYSIQLSALKPADGAPGSDAVRDPFIAIRAAVAAFPASGPLWQPTGPTLRGANSCEEMIDDPSLSEIVGEPMRVFRSYSHWGEFALSSFGASRQVSAFGCAWTSDLDGGTTSVKVSVLPGGASYFEQSNAENPEIGYAPVTGYPGQAYLSADGTTLSVLVEDGWVQVEAPGEALPAITELVLANVGPVPAVGG